jgi:hypothetical protein
MEKNVMIKNYKLARFLQNAMVLYVLKEMLAEKLKSTDCAENNSTL